MKLYVNYISKILTERIEGHLERLFATVNIQSSKRIKRFQTAKHRAMEGLCKHQILYLLNNWRGRMLIHITCMIRLYWRWAPLVDCMAATRCDAVPSYRPFATRQSHRVWRAKSPIDTPAHCPVLRLDGLYLCEKDAKYNSWECQRATATCAVIPTWSA